jgi:hypothetical protein
MHIPGKKMIQSDALFRHSDHVPDRNEDDEEMTLLLEGLFL